MHILPACRSAGILVLALIALVPQAHAGAWTQPVGVQYTKISQRLISGTRAKDARGRVLELGERYLDTSLNFYAEYGLTERLTILSFGTPLGYASFGESKTGYIGPLNVGARLGLGRSELKFALEAHYGFAPPVGDGTLSTGFIAGTPYFYQPNVSSHRFDLEAQVGRALRWVTVTGALGIRGYSNDVYVSALYGNVQLRRRSGDFGMQLGASGYFPNHSFAENNLAGAGNTRYVGFNVGGSWWVSDNAALIVALEGAPYQRANSFTPAFVVGVEHSTN